MIKTKFYLKVFLLLFVTVSLFNCCKKDDPQPDAVTQNYYVENTLVATYQKTVVKALLAMTPGIDASIANSVQYDANVYKVNYKTAYLGDTIIASGLVCIPTSTSSFPIMSFQHGTILTNSEAPTGEISNPVSASAGLSYVACTGMIVLIPDYIGFGASSNIFHPFLHKKSTASAVIDFIRAAKEFCTIEQTGNYSNKLFLLGYSQGGNATMATLSEIENNPKNNDLSVTATVAGAGPYNLNGVREFMVKQEKYEQPYYLPYVVQAFNSVSTKKVSLNAIFGEQYATKIPSLFNQVKTGSEINSELTQVISWLLTDNFRNNYSTDTVFTTMNEMMVENAVTAWPLKSYVRLYHGLKDKWIPPGQTSELFDQFVTQGSANQAKVAYIPFPDFDHSTAAMPTISAALVWFKTK